MDVVEQALALLNLRGSLYFRADLRGAWAVEIPPEPNCIRFHLVTGGSCWLWQPSGSRWIELFPRDFVLVSAAEPHILASAPDLPAVALPEVIGAGALGADGVLRAGDTGGRPTGLVCGFYRYEAVEPPPLLATLPAHLLLRATDDVGSAWLADALRLTTSEAAAQAPGSAAVLNRLSEILLVLALRTNTAQQPVPKGLIAALQHPGVGRALSAIHATPNADWSVTELASLAGMSRSSFSDWFCRLLDCAPMRYLGDLRLDLARQLLDQRDDQSLQQVGEQVGYPSESAFSRAFKRRFGQPPGRYRRDLAITARTHADTAD